MQKSETRLFLEEQFDKLERLKNLDPASADEMLQSPENEEEVGFAEEFLQAPAAYKKEHWEAFKTLPPEMRKYLHERESEVEKSFSRLNNELQSKKFLDEAFSTKGCRHGFKNARDWIEKLILAEDLLEASPRDTLCHLAKSYGVDFGAADAKKSETANLGELKMELLCEGFMKLQQRFEERERYYAEMATAAESARKAKAAGFSPQGKASYSDGLEEMTTRQILEKKFAELDD